MENISIAEAMHVHKKMEEYLKKAQKADSSIGDLTTEVMQLKLKIGEEMVTHDDLSQMLQFAQTETQEKIKAKLQQFLKEVMIIVESKSELTYVDEQLSHKLSSVEFNREVTKMN